MKKQKIMAVLIVLAISLSMFSGCSNPNSVEPNDNSNTVAYTRDGNYIYFGEYPQTIKADNVTITSTVDSRGYHLGSDGNYYAEVTATPYGDNYNFSTGESVLSGTVYYFKVEPIRWRILSENDGVALILCDCVIANIAYQSDYAKDNATGFYYTSANGAPDGTYSNNYKYSSVRAWLNSTFYETAFSNAARNSILTTEVDNSLASTTDAENPYICENTNDKVFLLSKKEATNNAYGFAAFDAQDAARILLTSDYTRASGVIMSTSESDYGCSRLYLRSPSKVSSYWVYEIFPDGNANVSFYVSNICDGVVPALRIRL